jgi:hypothetical protein
MAYVVARGGGSWEIRETLRTDRGPRSRTLAGFRTLTPAVIERASMRASRPLDAERLRQAARRAGAPVDMEGGDPDSAAASLLRELAAGRRPRPPLVHALQRALAGGAGAGDGSAAAGALAWLAATPRERGEALRDLLLLVDGLPRARRRRAGGLRFPRLQSKPIQSG